MVSTVGRSLCVSTKVSLQRGVTPRDACFGNLLNFPGQGARQLGTYLVLPCLQSRKISFPLLTIVAVLRYCSQCRRRLHYHNALVFLVGDGQGQSKFAKKLYRPGNYGREHPALLPLLTPPRIIISLCSHKMLHLIGWVPRSWASIP